MSVIERAEQRLAEEERQHELGADNRYDLHYWAAYLDGARAQKKEGGELAMSALNYVERQGFMTGMDYAGMMAEERETLLKELRDLHVGPVAPLVAWHDYTKLIDDLHHADNLTADHRILALTDRAASAIEELTKPKHTDYGELVKALRETATFTKFDDLLSKREQKLESLAFDAAAAIEALEARLGEAENSVERWKDMYLTKHEPKRGEWIIDGAYTYNLRELNGKAYEPVYRCSCCNRQTESYLRLDEPKMPEDADFPEYCPHCGAKMEVQDGQ